MTSTFATVIIPAASKAAAQIDLPGSFSAAYTTDPTGVPPATHYVASGHFYNTELDLVVNEAPWPKVVKFGDAIAALAELGIVAVIEGSGVT